MLAQICQIDITASIVPIFSKHVFSSSCRFYVKGRDIASHPRKPLRAFSPSNYAAPHSQNRSYAAFLLMWLTRHISMTKPMCKHLVLHRCMALHSRIICYPHICPRHPWELAGALTYRECIQASGCYQIHGNLTPPWFSPSCVQKYHCAVMDQCCISEAIRYLQAGSRSRLLMAIVAFIR